MKDMNKIALLNICAEWRHDDFYTQDGMWDLTIVARGEKGEFVFIANIFEKFSHDMGVVFQEKNGSFFYEIGSNKSMDSYLLSIAKKRYDVLVEENQ